jgi:hypothetical protein
MRIFLFKSAKILFFGFIFVAASFVLGASVSAQNSSVTVTGTISAVESTPAEILEAEPFRGTQVEAPVDFSLIDDTGKRWELATDPVDAQALEQHINEPVEITGNVTQTDTIDVDTIAKKQIKKDTQAFIPQSPVTGNNKYFIALCKFSDSTIAPPARSRFVNIMANTYPGLNHYYKTISYNNLNVTADVSSTWLTLDHPLSYYAADYELFGEDCLTKAEAEVDFINYDSLMAIADRDYMGGGIAGRGTVGKRTVSTEGIIKDFSIVWINGGGGTQHVMGHEIGHNLLFQHSSGPYGLTYDSKWDIMSSGYRFDSLYTTNYGAIASDTVAYHKQKSSWIPGNKIAVYNGFNEKISLESLHEQPANWEANSKLVVNIPTPDPAIDYTLESRFKHDYDQAVPFEGVVIHRITNQDLYIGNGSFIGKAQVYDPDNNNNTNDITTTIQPGQSVFLAETGMYVSVYYKNVAARTFEVQLSRTLPVVEINPTSQPIYQLGNTVNMTAFAFAGSTANVNNVEFVNANNTSIVFGQDNTAPYDINYTPAVGGEYRVQARATLSNGAIVYSNNSINFSVPEAGNNWTMWHGDFGNNTITAFALEEHNGKLYQSFTGTDNRVYTRSTASTDPYNMNWSPAVATVPFDYTQFPVSLTSHNGRLYQVAVGYNNKVYTRSSTNGLDWNAWDVDDNVIGEYTINRVNQTSFNGRLYQVAVGIGNQVWTRSSLDGINWTYWDRDENVVAEYTIYPVTQSAYQGKLHQVAVGFGNKMYKRESVDGINWTYWQLDTTSSISSIASEVQAELLGTKLFQSHRGANGEVFTRSSTDFGVSFSNWKTFQANETTPHSIALSTFNETIYEGSVLLGNKLFTRGYIL